MKTALPKVAFAASLLLGSSLFSHAAALPNGEAAQRGSYDPSAKIKCVERYEGELHVVRLPDRSGHQHDIFNRVVTLGSDKRKTLTIESSRASVSPTRFSFQVCHGPAFDARPNKEYGQLKAINTGKGSGHDDNLCVSAARRNVYGSEDHEDEGPNEFQMETCSKHENAHLQRQLFHAHFDEDNNSVRLTLIGTPNRSSSEGYKPEVVVVDDREIDVKGAVAARTSSASTAFSFVLYDVKTQ